MDTFWFALIVTAAPGVVFGIVWVLGHLLYWHLKDKGIF